MHFDFTISLGNLLTIAGMVGAIWRIEVLAARYLVEHEILVLDYCERHDLKPENLPTRTRR